MRDEFTVEEYLERIVSKSQALAQLSRLKSARPDLAVPLKFALFKKFKSLFFCYLRYLALKSETPIYEADAYEGNLDKVFDRFIENGFIKEHEKERVIDFAYIFFCFTHESMSNTMDDTCFEYICEHCTLFDAFIARQGHGKNGHAEKELTF